MKLKGFTLLELIITTFILSITLVIGLPNFTKLLTSAEQDKIGKELVGLFIQAKSEAVLKNQNVYVHFTNISKAYSESKDWCVLLTTTETNTACETNNETIAMIDGDNFQRTKMKRTEEYEKLIFDPIRGHPSFKYDEEFVDVLIFYSQDKNKVTSLRSHFMGRIGLVIPK